MTTTCGPAPLRLGEIFRTAPSSRSAAATGRARCVTPCPFMHQICDLRGAADFDCDKNGALVARMSLARRGDIRGSPHIAPLMRATDHPGYKSPRLARLRISAAVPNCHGGARSQVVTTLT